MMCVGALWGYTWNASPETGKVNIFTLQRGLAISN